MLGLARAANCCAVSAWASRRLPMTRYTDAAQARAVEVVASLVCAGYRGTTCLHVSVVVRAVGGGGGLAGVSAVAAAVDRASDVALREAPARRFEPVAAGGVGRFHAVPLGAGSEDDGGAIPG